MQNLKPVKLIKVLAISLCVFLVIFIANSWIIEPRNQLKNLNFKENLLFKESQLSANLYRAFDIGVTDINLDNYIDIFSSNHNHKQLILLNQGRLKFSSNKVSEFQLDQDEEFPGLEFNGEIPSINAPGLYIYWNERKLIIQAHKHNNNTLLQGTVSMSTPATAVQKINFLLDTKTTKSSAGGIVTTFDFILKKSNGNITISPTNVSLPIKFEIKSGFSPDRVYIGNDKVSPTSNQFKILLRDRHGMAWSSYDDKGIMDVFIVRGGLKGRLEKISEPLNDELLIDTKGKYKNRISESGLRKEGCPALQTAWVDFDQDNALDIYTVCFQAANDTQPWKNQLYRKLPNDKFVSAAKDTNLDITEMGSFFWLDPDNDNDIDLFWVNNDQFKLYLNENGRFKVNVIGNNPGNVAIRFEESNKVTVSDYDSDGDLDLFIASPQGNALLVNTNKAKNFYKIIDPKDVGLPTKSLTANWVDYDNDGQLDLHSVPGGLYQQTQGNLFLETHLLSAESKNLLETRCTWFDANNDGSRDLLIGTRYADSILTRIYKKIKQNSSPKATFWNLSLYTNVGQQGNWLQVQLIGPPGNLQAIGAHVDLHTSNSIERQVVGQAEGSHYSQGHYRLYFGLGECDQVSHINVFWPNGQIQKVENIPINQIFTIRYKDVGPSDFDFNLKE
jgi:hypothetical protein